MIDINSSSCGTAVKIGLVWENNPFMYMWLPFINGMTRNYASQFVAKSSLDAGRRSELPMAEIQPPIGRILLILIIIIMSLNRLVLAIRILIKIIMLNISLN